MLAHLFIFSSKVLKDICLYKREKYFYRMKNRILVFIGGGIGSVCRFLINSISTISQPIFPFPTFLVNLFGSLLIGIFMGLLMDSNPTSENWKLLLISGFCGGFTTFSAFSKESFEMIQNQQWSTLSLYVLLSLAVCIGATALGFNLAK